MSIPGQATLPFERSPFPDALSLIRATVLMFTEITCQRLAASRQAFRCGLPGLPFAVRLAPLVTGVSMVATVQSYSTGKNRASTAEGWDGVVRVSAGGFYGSGALLFDGHAVLTAAHVVAHAFGTQGGGASVHFETASGSQTVAVDRVLLHPGYDSNGNNDLALVWLAEAAPLAAERYDIYRDDDELLQGFVFAGYGVPGTGRNGMDESYDGDPVRQWGINRFDADPAILKQSLGPVMGWQPLMGSQLLADFDNGLQSQDALGRFLGIHERGYAEDEGNLTSGDSGGPAFLAGKVAGVASYGASLSAGAIAPDYDQVANNAGFGEMAAWQRVSFYQQWIDQSLRAQYQDAPDTAASVVRHVTEGHDGASLAYFLLEFTGVRSDPQQWLSVDYCSRDGSAVAGEDYLAVSGRLVLYPGENKAVIPVEILGDALPEADETFYLDVFNPVGGSFGAGVLTLSAMRTIVDDDGWLLASS